MDGSIGETVVHKKVEMFSWNTISNFGVDFADPLIFAAGTCPYATCWTDKGVDRKPHVTSVAFLCIERLNPGTQVAALRRIIRKISNVSVQRVGKSAPLLFQQALEGFENHTRDFLTQTLMVVAPIPVNELVMEDGCQSRTGTRPRACRLLWMHSGTRLLPLRWKGTFACRLLVIQVNERCLLVVKINERNISLIRGVICFMYIGGLILLGRIKRTISA